MGKCLLMHRGGSGPGQFPEPRVLMGTGRDEDTVAFRFIHHPLGPRFGVFMMGDHLGASDLAPRTSVHVL